MEARRKELERQINVYWVEYLKLKAEIRSMEAEAEYIKKLHDLKEQELEEWEKYGND